MKRVLYLFVFLLLASCSTEDDQLRESQSCNCDKLTEVFESDAEDATLLNAIVERTFDVSCNPSTEPYFTENGYYVVITWSNCNQEP